MSYRSKYQDDHWSRDSRPRSESPPPHHHRYSHSPPRRSSPSQIYREKYSPPPPSQPHRQHYSQGNYQNHGYQPYHQKWTNNNYGKPYPVLSNHKKPLYPRTNNRKPYNYNRGNFNPRFSDHTNYESTDHPSSHKPLAKSNSETGVGGDSSSQAYIKEAVQTYDTDRNTVAEVTQLLINEDKDIESRLLVAMEKVLIEIKRKHDIHMKYISKTLLSNVPVPEKRDF